MSLNGSAFRFAFLLKRICLGTKQLHFSSFNCRRFRCICCICTWVARRVLVCRGKDENVTHGRTGPFVPFTL